MKKVPESMLSARVPASLVKKLERAAKQAQRTRSAELRVRLEESLRSVPTRSAG